MKKGNLFVIALLVAFIVTIAPHVKAEPVVIIYDHPTDAVKKDTTQHCSELIYGADCICTGTFIKQGAPYYNVWLYGPPVDTSAAMDTSSIAYAEVNVQFHSSDDNDGCADIIVDGITVVRIDTYMRGTWYVRIRGLDYDIHELIVQTSTDTTGAIPNPEYPVPRLGDLDVWYICYYDRNDAVTIADFKATGHDGRVDVEWTTATEIGNAGFNLYRSNSLDGWRKKLNESLIPSRGNELQGASYSFTDKDIDSGIEYHYWFEDVALSGETGMHGPVLVSGKDESPLPVAFSLNQNYPNPFNPVTEIMYDLPVDCHVRLEVYNVLGQKVATLVNEYQTAGGKVISWDGRDERGMAVSSGVYFYKLHAGTFTEIKKMALMR